MVQAKIIFDQAYLHSWLVLIVDRIVAAILPNDKLFELLWMQYLQEIFKHSDSPTLEQSLMRFHPNLFPENYHQIQAEVVEEE